MSDPGRDRLQRDVEDLITRVRMLENLQTPGQAQALADLRDLARHVHDMDVHGSTVAQLRLAGLEEDLRRLETTMAKWEAEKAADRRVVLGALLAAATAIGMAVIGVIIQLATRGTP